MNLFGDRRTLTSSFYPRGPDESLRKSEKFLKNFDLIEEPSLFFSSRFFPSVRTVPPGASPMNNDDLSKALFVNG